MSRNHHSPLNTFGLLSLLLLSLTLMLSCSPPIQKPVGPAADYQDAKDMFKRGRFDRALEFTDGLAKATPPTSHTERARVLRAVIFTAKLKSSQELADAYEKGKEKTKNPHFQAEYGRLRHDNLQYGSSAALALAETAHPIIEGGTISNEFTLEADYPTTEGPLEVKELLRVEEGGWIEPDQQESAALDSQRKGVDDALAEILSGDRAKARTSLASGSAKISGSDFALFLGKQLLVGATFFDHKHGRDFQKLKILCTEADTAAKAGLDLLKKNPDKDKEKDFKKLQADIKTELKNT
jgi:hypothetical protein